MVSLHQLSPTFGIKQSIRLPHAVDKAALPMPEQGRLRLRQGRPASAVAIEVSLPAGTRGRRRRQRKVLSNQCWRCEKARCGMQSLRNKEGCIAYRMARSCSLRRCRMRGEITKLDRDALR